MRREPALSLAHLEAVAQDDACFGVPDGPPAGAMGLWECDLSSERLIWTAGVYDIFGLPTGSLIERSGTLDLYDPESRTKVQELRALAIQTKGSFVLDTKIRTVQGETRWMRITAVTDFTPNRRPRIHGSKQDITAEKLELRRLRRLAERDPLTGLANRRLFDEIFTARRTPVGTPPHGALILVDVDHFKQVNDRHGHLAGDECLAWVASRLRRAFTDATLIARLGGDEFAVLLPAPVDAAQLDRRLTRAHARLRQPILWNSQRIETSCSLGAALTSPSGACDPAGLFAQADEALYAIKRANRAAAGTAPSPCNPAFPCQ